MARMRITLLGALLVFATLAVTAQAKRPRRKLRDRPHPTRDADCGEAQLKKRAEQRRKKLKTANLRGGADRDLQTSTGEAVAESLAISWVNGKNPPFSPIQQPQAFPLATFYYATGGASWMLNTNWLSYGFGFCQWYNQKDASDICDATNQVLVELELRENGLVGVLPTALGGLSLLEELDIQENAIGGTLPTQLAQMAALDELNLGENSFVGPIPTHFGNMQVLEHLYLDRNQLTGTVPLELGNMMGMKDLDLSENELEGTFPNQLLSLSNLQTLSLYYSKNFTGTIPAGIYILPDMEEIDLEYNYFRDTIPTTIGLSSTLEYISVKDNYMFGTIPWEIFNISTLVELRLDDNRFTGRLPTNIPVHTNLLEFQVDENRLVGPIPTQFGNLLALEKLKLAENDLTGTVPVELTRLVNLTELDLNETSLVGAIPAGLCNIPELVFQCRPGIGLCGCGCPCAGNVVPPPPPPPPPQVPATPAPFTIQNTPATIPATPRPTPMPVQPVPRPPGSGGNGITVTIGPRPPTPAPVSSGGIVVTIARNGDPFDGTNCFSKDMTVVVQGRDAPVAMSDIQIGDSILTAGGTFSKVYAFGHSNPHKYADFTRVWTDGSGAEADALEVTGEHLVYLHGKANPVRADSIRVGDQLVGSQNSPVVVTRLESVRKQGIYAPLTREGSLVVNDIAASSYVAFQSTDDEYVQLQLLGATQLLSHHDLTHILLAPFRLMCSESVYPGFCDGANGIFDSIAWGRDLVNWILTHRNGIVQCLGLILILAVAGVGYVLERILCLLAIPGLLMSGSAGAFAVVTLYAEVQSKKKVAA